MAITTTPRPGCTICNRDTIIPSGAVSATGIGIIGSMAFGAVSGFLSSCFRDLLFESEKSWEDTLVDASWNALFGGVSGLIAGAGANHSTNKIV